jgi:two-component system cell cycle sensor histidine kinase/response regulator CckA
MRRERPKIPLHRGRVSGAPRSSCGIARIPARVHDDDMARTILLVEDHRSVRAALKAVLERAGHDVLEAPNGERAIEIARGHPGPIDVLLADVVMPGIDGFEVARSVRTLRPRADNLFMSGHLGSARAAEVAENKGLFLAKPFAAADLRRALDEIHNGQEPRPPPPGEAATSHSTE